MPVVPLAWHPTPQFGRFRCSFHRRTAFAVRPLLSGRDGRLRPDGRRRHSAGSSNRLVEADFAEYVSQDILTVIQRLRPQWLRVRGGGTAQGKAVIQIFIDGQRQNGGPDVLRGMSANSVQEVEFMNARDATTRYGTDMAGGAIVVTTKH